ncbi:MAG TPA: hypothetical protein VHE13_07165 [Opitutus sp.]|nr:hypothetical protein [Opitutus sp.]
MRLYAASVVGASSRSTPAAPPPPRRSSSGANADMLFLREGGGGVYLVWPSRTLVPARVVAVRDFLADALAAKAAPWGAASRGAGDET